MTETSITFLVNFNRHYSTLLAVYNKIYVSYVRKSFLTNDTLALHVSNVNIGLRPESKSSNINEINKCQLNK